MSIIVFGLNHKTAPVEIREKVAMTRVQIKNRAPEFRVLSRVEGLVILSTCNRTEYYTTTRDLVRGKEELISLIADFSGCAGETLERHAYIKEGRQAVHHLFRVAAGLDSMILGESQILGQVVEAYDTACQCGMSNPILNGLFLKAIFTGKKARTETLIDRLAVSVGSAAVDLASQILGELTGRTALVLGTGETGELVLRNLVGNGVSTVVVGNRTYANACKLAQEFGGQAIRLDDFSLHLVEADIVISCTAAPHYIVKAEDLQSVLSARAGRPLLFIDIAVPRDIHPAVAALSGISVYDIDDLEQVVQKNLAERRREAIKVDLLVNEEINKFYQWFDSLAVVPTIRALKEKAEKIRKQEIDWALRKLGPLSERDKKIINSLVTSTLNKILNEPIANLKEYARRDKENGYSQVLCKLFNLEPGDEDGNREGAL